jgi:phage portal protein BeeE
MNFLGLNISVNRNPKIENRNSPLPPPPVTRSLSAAFLRGDDTDNAGSVLVNAYEQVVWVYRAINVLAEQVANIPFLFSSGERGGENLITSGPLLDFYSHPHPHVNQFQYWELRIMWLMLRGECFRIPVWDDSPSSSFSSSSSSSSGGRRLKSILFLDPAAMQPILKNHELAGWRYTGSGVTGPIASQVFLPEEVWFEKLPNPFNFWRGMAPLHAAALAAKTDHAAASFMRGLMENNADLGVIVNTEQQLTDEQKLQILADLRNRKRHAGTADRPLILSGGAEITKPELSSADLQFLENRKFSRSEICAAFGVPEEIVTTTDKAKYDVMAGARLNFLENRIIPLCIRLEAEEEVTVKAIDPKAVGWFDTDSVPLMQEARRTRLEAAKTGFDMGIPFNELNRIFDLGFKHLPWGDTGYLPSKLNPVGTVDDKSSSSSFSSSSSKPHSQKL